MNEFERQMMGRATEIINAQPKLKEQSEVREKNKFQEEMPFDGCAILREDEIERRPCTEKEKVHLDKDLEKLGDIFEGADFYWQLDGALNISLYRDEYIGVHKDIDISMDINDLEKAEEFLGRRGFGMFIGSGGDWGKKRVFERVSPQSIRNNTQKWGFMIFAIDKEGKIKDRKEGFGIDTHIIYRNEDGEPLGNRETPIPQEWLEPRTIDFHGRKVNCSHPAAVAYHKMFFTRGYDNNDMKLLAESGMLTLQDVNIIEKYFDMHFEYLTGLAIGYVEKILSSLQMASGKNEIHEILVNHELVQDKKDPIFEEMADRISSMLDISAESVLKMIIEVSPSGKILQGKNEKLTILRNNIPNGNN